MSAIRTKPGARALAPVGRFPPPDPDSRTRRPRDGFAAPALSDSRDQLSEKRVELSLSLSLLALRSLRCIRWDKILQHFSSERRLAL